MLIRAFMCLTVLAACQSSGGAVSRTLPSAEHLMRSWTQAFLRRDIQGMLGCYEASADTILFHSTGALVRGIDGIRSDYAAAFESTEFLAVEFKPVVVRQVDEFAWMTGRLWMHTRQAGRDYVLELGTSFSLRWVEGAWRIVMEQSTPLAGVPRIREVRPGERLAPLLSSVLLSCSANSGRNPTCWIGKGEADVRDAYASSATEAGVVYLGGSGRRRLYFALGDGTQVWFDLDWADTVESAGGPEPKTRWVRHTGDSLTVEQFP